MYTCKVNLLEIDELFRELYTEHSKSEANWDKYNIQVLGLFESEKFSLEFPY